MRLRNAAVAAFAAIALAVSLPGSAMAAVGEFRYSYADADGYEHPGLLFYPPSGECLNLPGADSDELDAAYAPKNGTRSIAQVYLGADCQGPSFLLRPGGGATERLQVRSVVFS
ncbi:hypothetical protein CFP65_7505 [Kitasatospora sp. MMS16-BH015]|uniref:hypothetical protein n=1 Tax=Kitasatospora sp. MMS16-BH015 TaxID=2018025 RepID=UPI000CA21531|nr:hypothetical protein [Kitasatospora sp. MMS16-BH015]AUG82082.1 hypothetical protein CFP65_7505 [Kitasatospora sp. MMS16-BH015]